MKTSKRRLEKERLDKLRCCYAWFMNATQTARTLFVLGDLSMTTGGIKSEVRRQFQGNEIEQRTVIKIIKKLAKRGLVQEVKMKDRKDYGKVYRATSLGIEMLELMKANQYRGIWLNNV